MNQSHSSQSAILETEHFKVHLNSSAANASTNYTLLNSTVAEKDCEPPSLTSFTTGPATSTAVEFNIKDSLVNLITCAYTHSGYPISTTVGNGCNAIYGAYVELRNPSLNGITFPPDEMIVVSDIPRESAKEMNTANPSSIVSSPNSSDIPAIGEPLVRVIWRRGSHLLNSRIAEKLPTPATGPILTSPNSSSAVVLPRLAPSSTSQRLRQCPEGICDVQTSARLNEILLEFEPNDAHTEDSTTQVNNNTTKSSDNTSSNNNNNNNNNNTKKENGIGSSETVNPPPGTGIPSGEESNGDMPIQTTLITANSFNHLSTYGVRHQNGKIFSTTPLQSITAAISTRRITAHSLFFLSIIVGESYVAPGYQAGGSPQVLHGAEVKPAKKSWTTRKSSIAGALPNLAKGVEMNFEDIHLEGGVNGVGTDTVNVATLHIAVEPYLLFGNQSGDLFLFSVFEGKIIQRLNFSGGVSWNLNSEGSNVPRKQVVSAAVTCIVEVECGIEKHLAVVIDRACSSKMRNAKTFTVPSLTAEGVLPSVFAAGFDNGHILLISVTMSGACLNGHLTSFGERPIQGIAVQTPQFYLRLWPKERETRGVAFSSSQNKQKSKEKGDKKEKDKENNNRISHIEFISANTLVLCEDSRVVAINCDGGKLRLVKTSNLEVELCRTVALANNTAGDFLAIKWVASSAEFTLYPDLIVVTSEDDSLMVYQFLQISGGSKSKFTRTFSFLEETMSSGPVPGKLLMSNSSQRTGENLVFLERRRFHRSWVGDLCLLPVSDAYLLIATSYDGRSSFWPLYHAVVEEKSKESFLPPPSEDAPFIQECFYDFIIQDDSSQHVSSRLKTSVLADEPTTAVVLHTDMTVRCTVGGAGCSHFLVSLCLRGRVKFWEVKSVSS
ncbi:hypothetical protein LSM04_005841 [Trypanosoma melophagium]|uniref:uncharacterized protein n=1 Tax=Trypanosoma melophagium TaxID=715481 RepID=UPI003519DBD7|nr:hypothetical protein LSM04_005841 [Trypanosoma melophagium]